MAFNKPSNNISKVALIVAVLLLASQIMPSHGSPLVANSRRYLLQSAPTRGMIEGTVTPTDGGAQGAPTEDVRPTTPTHSPGIGHAFINNKIGRKLLTVSQ
ncbi:hypothetical protein HU200_034921 [Digitaria exilis]|uniref:Uncharacterized protein n=1 Tax=Digitaria exilis TaxID=1010633 RepID=A0A835BFS3_9POAL|nr:hypothetical protein HU200_034921 [Digitaria exilis]